MEIVECNSFVRKYANLPIDAFVPPLLYYDLDCTILGCRHQHNFEPIIWQLQALEINNPLRQSLLMVGSHGAHILTNYQLPGTCGYEGIETFDSDGFMVEELDFVNLFNDKQELRSTFPEFYLLDVLKNLDSHWLLVGGKKIHTKTVIAAARYSNCPCELYDELGIGGYDYSKFYTECQSVEAPIICLDD